MNSSNAFSFLIGTLLDLYVTALLLRLLLQWVRADFYNPVCQFLVQITNPVVVPLRRVIPPIRRLDTATVVLIAALEAISVWVASRLADQALAPITLLVLAVSKIVATVLLTYFFLIIVAVILSWVGAGVRHPVVPLVYQLTEPVLKPIRKVIPPIAGIDLSPLFALIGIQFLLVLIGW